MRDLLQFIRALLVGDTFLLALYQAAGAAKVSVIAPHQRAGATYPKIILEGEEGEQESFGDNLPKFFRGKVRLEIVTRQSDACPDALDTLRQLQDRQRDLLLGNSALDLPGIQGRAVSSAWNVPRFFQCSPTRTLPTSDPTIQRHLTTYDVLLNRVLAGSVSGLPENLPMLSSAEQQALQSQIDALTQQVKDLQMATSLPVAAQPDPIVTLTATSTLTRPTQSTVREVRPTANMVTTLYSATGSGIKETFDISALNGFTFAVALASGDSYDANNAAVADSIAQLITNGAASFALRDVAANTWHWE